MNMDMGMNQTVCYCKVMIEFINFTSLDYLFMIHLFMHTSAPMKMDISTSRMSIKSKSSPLC